MSNNIIAFGSRLLDRLAAARGEHPETVRGALQELIDKGMRDKRPSVQAYWAQIPSAGPEPTPEELVLFLTGEVFARAYPLTRTDRLSGDSAQR